MLFKEIIAVYSKTILNAELLIIKVVALKG
jgi:hypothetical protein